ncbi:MAG: serine/threonine-protein kinase [Vicinamibacterales bacterium]|jgi:serine/threonine protein kinase|nr:hypothetical protein [Acidobacteriota bacterium]MDP6372759.1 serine/threonine-protein kinase [Vicinamibacterales bacterium]|tara:strand:- start:3591 stop:6254 length:2664 start_codon:yes stop_codon:yes gene_type:complete
MTGQDDAPTASMGAQPKKIPERIGRYELIERIGKGGMGVVYRARDTQLQREVALKMLLINVAEVEETQERFRREARAAADLRHRNIIQVYDFGEEDGRAFFVMELLAGDSLSAELKGGKRLPLDRALDIMSQMCDGLAFAHGRSIVHRDLKPANLFVTPDGTIKILDFGLARIASSKLTRSGLIFGTPDYMSPEQVRGKVADHRSDIFSVGAVLYQLVSGRKPFAAESLPLVMRKVVEEPPPPLKGVPPALERIIARALQKDPADRYQGVEALLVDLRCVDRAAPATAEPEPDADETVLVSLGMIGRYRVLERVGQGGMGVVYRAHDPVLDRDVAIKSILGEFGDDEESSADHFEREARAAARLQHPNIITIYELGEAEGAPYIVMEFLDGTDLDGLMRRSPPLALADRVQLVIQLCAGLSFAHAQGVIHRDIKPSNVRVLEDGTVKLLDFGIAKRSGSDPSFSDPAGSVEYMSPEQLNGEAVDVRTDVFAVGALMYELFGGGAPFKGDSPAAVAYQILNEEPASLRAAVPEALEQVVARALQKQPEARYASADELLTALRLVCETALAEPSRRPAIGEAAGDIVVARGVASLGRPAGDIAVPGVRPSAEAASALARRRGTWPRFAGAAALVLAVGVGAYVAVGSAVGSAVDWPTVPRIVQPPPSGPDPVYALSVDSDPTGARVVFDGEDILLLEGETVQVQTPTTVPFRGGFPQMIRLTRGGFQPVDLEVPEASGPTLRIVATLGAPVPTGRLVLSGPYLFEVWQGNRRVRNAATEHEIRVQAGAVTLRVRNQELFLDQRVTADVAADQRREFPVGAAGTVTVFSRPGNCEILIDEQTVGFPPIQNQPIAAGRHTVSRLCPDAAQNTSQPLSVEPGAAVQVTFSRQ